MQREQGHPILIPSDDVAKDPSDCLSPLTSAKSYFSESRYSARYVPANTMAYDTLWQNNKEKQIMNQTCYSSCSPLSLCRYAHTLATIVVIFIFNMNILWGKTTNL